MDNSKLKNASTLYLIGNFFNKGIAFLSVPIFTRLLSTSDYGIINTYQSWIGIAVMIMGYALHMGIYNSFVDYKDKTEEYLSTILKFTLISTAVIVLLACCVVKIFNISIPLFLIVMLLLHATSIAILDDISYYLMMKYQYVKRTLLMILPNLLSVCVSMIIIKFVLDSKLYYGRIFTDAITWIVFAVIIVIAYVKKGGINREFLKHGLKISLPLIVHGATLSILSNSDRIMITWLADSSQSGIYSLAYSFGSIAYAIFISFDGVWMPWFMNSLSEKKHKEINSVTNDYTRFITYIMCCLIIVSPELLKILASKPYWEGIKIIPLIVLANFLYFLYTRYSNLEHFYKKSTQITLLTVVAAVINVGLNFLLIPKLGYVAAAFTTVIAYFVIFILHSIYSKTLNPEVLHIKSFILPLIEVLISCGLFYLLLDKPIIRWVGMFVYLGVVAYLERKKIEEILLPNIKKKIFKK